MNTLQLQFLLSILAGWVNRGQQDLIAYLQEENRVLDSGHVASMVPEANRQKVRWQPGAQGGPAEDGG